MRFTGLNDYRNLFTEYTELRVQENYASTISLVNGDVAANTRARKGGVSARVYKNGQWGLASTPKIDEKSIKDSILNATDNVTFLSSRAKMPASTLPSRHASGSFDFSTKQNRWSDQEINEFLKTVDNYIKENCPNLLSRNLVLKCLDMEKTLETADDSSSYSLIPRTIIALNLCVSDKNNMPISLMDFFGGRGQFEDQFSSPENLFSKIDKQYQNLLLKAEGIYPEAGIKTCILDAEVAGILAHEAIGHTTEADLVQGGSVAGGLMGQEVASPLITLTDFAHTAFGETCPVPVNIDDEGVEALDTTIIENGILKSFMHNKDTALQFDTSVTGNARAMDFYDEPLVRMRNTAIQPGKSKIEEMISSIDDGYYLIRNSNGQADSTSEFMFGITEGYEIKNGKLGRALKDFTISGVGFDVLKSTTMVSDEISWSCAGFCGKKQMIPVGMGGPSIKCEVNIGGK